MKKIKLVDILKEVLYENVGPGLGDTRPMSQIYNDVYNQFLYSPETVKNYDPETGYDLFSDEEKLNKGKQLFNKKFNGEETQFNTWKNKHNLAKGRKPRYVNMNVSWQD